MKKLFHNITYHSEKGSVTFYPTDKKTVWKISVQLPNTLVKYTAAGRQLVNPTNAEQFLNRALNEQGKTI